jgi:hypothetical protein
MTYKIATKKCNVTQLIALCLCPGRHVDAVSMSFPPKKQDASGK